MRRDLPIDICSHKRSGTHFLAATLHENFVLPDASITTAVHQGKSFTMDETIWKPGSRITIPWGGLWRSHNFYNPPWFIEPEKILYIVRHPVRTLMSYWKFLDPLGLKSVDTFLGENNVKFWYRHAKGYTKSCYYIRYEDLAGDKHKDVLDGIADHYGLEKKRQRYKRVNGGVGWYSGEKPLKREKLESKTIDNFKKILPEGFLGYDIGYDEEYHKSRF